MIVMLEKGIILYKIEVHHTINKCILTFMFKLFNPLFCFVDFYKLSSVASLKMIMTKWLMEIVIL
jgi:hypothetical protein